MSSSRLFRVFVSSTFKDFVAERNALQSEVFPRLQRFCQERGARFQGVDLRWGVSEEAGRDQQSLEICLEEVRRCQQATPRPNFILLLGNRYGWRPPPPRIPAEEFAQLRAGTSGHAEKSTLERWYRRDDNALPASYLLRPIADHDSWLQAEAQLRGAFRQALESTGWAAGDPRRHRYECSATHHEILSGLFEASGSLFAAREHVCAYLRQMDLAEEIAAGDRRSEFADYLAKASGKYVLDYESQTRLEQLKAEVRRQLPDAARYEYVATWNGTSVDVDLATFCRRVSTDLERTITAELARLNGAARLTGSKDQQDRRKPDDEAAVHRAFARERTAIFVGRHDALQRIDGYLKDNVNLPLVVEGVSGSGKTALLAQAAASAERTCRVVHRYLGTTPASSQLPTLLESLCRELTGEAAQGDLRELVQELPRRMARAGQERPLLVVLDALDQLMPSDDAHSLFWLPGILPAGCKLLVSALEREGPVGQCQRVAERVFPRAQRVCLGALSEPEADELLRLWLTSAGRTLQPVQHQHVRELFAGCRLPLYMRLVYEEVRRWRSFEGVPRPLASHTAGLLDDLFDGLESGVRHFRALVCHSLAYLGAARHGLAEDELLDLLAASPAVMLEFYESSKTEREKPPNERLTRLPPIFWSSLAYDLTPYLTQRQADGTTVLSFYHREVAEAVTARYGTGEMRQRAHDDLRRYFQGQPHEFVTTTARAPNLRKLSELPYQQRQSSDWNSLEATLTELEFVEAKCRAGAAADLDRDYVEALAALPAGAEGREAEAVRRRRLSEYAKALSEFAACDVGLLVVKQPKGSSVTSLPPAAPDSTPVLASLRGGGTRTDVGSERSRLPAFAQFFFTRRHLLAREPGETIVLARNHADAGPVVAQAEEKVRTVMRPWLRCVNRGPEPPAVSVVERVLDHAGLTFDAVAMTPDGRWAVTAGSNYSLYLWDLDLGQLVRSLPGHTARIVGVAVSADGAWAVSASRDKTICLWDLGTGRCLQTDQALLGKETKGLVMRPDAGLVLLLSDSGVEVWRVSPTGFEICLEAEGSGIKALALSGNGKTAYLGIGSEIHRWDFPALGASLCPGMSGISALALTPDGDTLVALGAGTLTVLDPSGGRRARLLECSAEPRWNRVALSADGRVAVTSHGDSDLHVWDLEAQTEATMPGHRHGIVDVALSADARRAVTVSIDRTMRVWRLDGQLKTVGGAHRGELTGLFLTPRGSDLLSVGHDGLLQVWDLARGKVHSKLPESGRRPQTSVVTASGLVASLDLERVIRVWNLGSGEKVASYEGDGPYNGSAVLAADDRTWAFATSRHIWIGDLALHHLVRQIALPATEVQALTFTADSRRLLGVTECHELLVWNVQTGSLMAGSAEDDGGELELSIGPHATVQVEAPRACVRILPGEARVLTTSEKDEVLKVWNLETGEVLQTWTGHTAGIRTLAMAPCGGCVVSGDRKGQLRHWNQYSGECLAVWDAHEAAVNAAVFTPSGRHVLTASDDRTVRLWDVATGKCLGVFLTDSPVQCLSPVNSGGLFACASEFGEVYVLAIENLSD
jgi:WD40 repeat protein